jgi:hypothetical protein
MQVVFRLYFKLRWFFLEQCTSCCGLYITSWNVVFLHPSYFWACGDVFGKFKLWRCYLEMQVWWFLLWTYGDVFLKCKLLGFFIVYYVDISWKWMLFKFCSLFYQIVFFLKMRVTNVLYYGLWWCILEMQAIGVLYYGLWWCILETQVIRAFLLWIVVTYFGNVGYWCSVLWTCGDVILKCKLLGFFNLGGCKVGWLTFCIIIQFFAKWHAFTCY